MRSILCVQMRVSRNWFFLIFLTDIFMKLLEVIGFTLDWRLLNRAFFVFSKITLRLLDWLFSNLRFILEISWPVWSLRADRLSIFFIKRSNHVALKGFNWVIVKWKEANAVMEIILCKDSIINSLETSIEINLCLEILLLRFAHESADHITDRKLSLSSIIKQVECCLNLFNSLLFWLPLEIIYQNRIVNVDLIFWQLSKYKLEVFILQKWSNWL